MAPHGSLNCGSISVFSLGCVLGVGFAILLNLIEEETVIVVKNKFRLTPKTSAFNWVLRNTYNRKLIDYDEMIYGGYNHIDTEADSLARSINVICVVFVNDDRKAITARDTWGSHCNDLMFFGRPKNYSLSVIQLKAKSSWHFLCETLRIVWNTRHRSLNWALFVPETQFAIPENLRFYVSSLNYIKPYYMGHALKFWGETYNVAQAGYVLSKGAIEVLQKKFNNSESCIAGGKFWKNEDFYLGKHLGEIGIYPEDTRDPLGRGRFHGYNFNQLLFPGKISSLGSYWTRSIYPIKEGRDCCSDYSITFHGTEPDKIYQHNYLLYQLKVFVHGGYFGNQPAPTPFPEESVWKNFLIEEGIEATSMADISSEEFFNIWKEKISDPDHFGSKRKEDIKHASNSNVLQSIIFSAKGMVICQKDGVEYVYTILCVM